MAALLFLDILETQGLVGGRDPERGSQSRTGRRGGREKLHGKWPCTYLGRMMHGTKSLQPRWIFQETKRTNQFSVQVEMPPVHSSIHHHVLRGTLSRLAKEIVGTNLICLPVKYFVLHLKRFGAHSEVLSKISSDVLGLTSLLKCLLGQLLDLDCCKLFLIPVDRQLCWCCDIKLDEICRHPRR